MVGLEHMYSYFHYLMQTKIIILFLALKVTPRTYVKKRKLLI